VCAATLVSQLNYGKSGRRMAVDGLNNVFLNTYPSILYIRVCSRGPTMPRSSLAKKGSTLANGQPKPETVAATESGKDFDPDPYASRTVGEA
jgi:hypothetical protein